MDMIAADDSPVQCDDSSISSGQLTPTSDSDAQLREDQRLDSSAVVAAVNAVANALKLTEQRTEDIVKVIGNTCEDQAQILSLQRWLQAVRSSAFWSEADLHVANVAVALAFLLRSGRRDIVVEPHDLDAVWTALNDALSCSALPWSMLRSAQGLLAIPVWSVVEDGRIRELIRVHVWLSDGVRAKAEEAIHTHQPFIQSWILGGQGTDHTYTVNSAGEHDATHAEYAVSWQAQDKGTDNNKYKVLSNASIITNTGKLVRAVASRTETHTRNMSYHVSEGTYHKTQVDPDALHATIAFFDSSRGYVQDAPVIGSITGHQSVFQRRQVEHDVIQVAKIVEDLRTWETLCESGTRHSKKGEWEEALRFYRTALHLCCSSEWMARSRYKHVILGEIGHMYRMLGLYQQACRALEETLCGTQPSQVRVMNAGELATVYRHMDRLEDSKRLCEEQYRDATLLKLDKSACRAVGTLGMVNYQLYQLNQDPALLESAIAQLTERVERAKQIDDLVLQAIGEGRLSLCYLAKGDFQKGVEHAKNNYDHMRMQHDSTKIGFSKAFYGRALLLAGRRTEACDLINAPDGCPPINSLCKEISGEHRQYILELIAAGADLKLRDEQDYSALECAVYNGDEETASILEQGLRNQISKEGGRVEEELKLLKHEAQVRKGYKDIFQDSLRPVLLAARQDLKIQQLRKAYAASLMDDLTKQTLFDGLKYVKYANFLQAQQLPRSDSGYVEDPVSHGRGHDDLFVLFFSYRLIAKDSVVQADGETPDDHQRTQYRRMLRAIELFLDKHRDVDRERLGVWIDFACVDQDDPRAGVASLPLNLAQCNAMISLTDDKYYDRSWCCVEVLMIQTLRRSYGLHLWYEHHIDPVSGEEVLRPGPWDMDVCMADKQVTYENDRPKVLFLERQTRLLG